MSQLTSLFISCTFVLFLIDGIWSQQPPYSGTVKPGSCPPPLPRLVCSNTCNSDLNCRGNTKCCPTSCGGTVCSRPVTLRKDVNLVKPGSCPASNEGTWFCSNTCYSDSDCRFTLKCCRNKCGARTCLPPKEE